MRFGRSAWAGHGIAAMIVTMRERVDVMMAVIWM